MTCMNLKRAGWAAAAVAAFAEETGAELWREAICDLLCDLGHLCDAKGFDFKAVVAGAIGTWRIEQDEPKGVSRPYPVTITVGVPEDAGIVSARKHPTRRKRPPRKGGGGVR